MIKKDCVSLNHREMLSFLLKHNFNNGTLPVRNQFDYPERDKQFDAPGLAFLTIFPERDT